MHILGTLLTFLCVILMHSNASVCMWLLFRRLIELARVNK